MRATIERISGISLVGKSDSNHWVPMDSLTSVGGTDAATSPMQLVLLGLGGCSAMDVLSILGKKRVQLDDFRLDMEAERAEEHPQVFTKIDMKFIFTGKNIAKEAVERAIELSVTKYCSVMKMLEKTVNITTQYEIVDNT